MAWPEKTLIWSEIKAALPVINMSGENSGDLLVWSQDKNLEEVKERTREITEEVNNNNQEHDMDKDDITVINQSSGNSKEK